MSNSDNRKNDLGAAPVEWKYDPKVSEAKYKKWFPELSSDTVAKLIAYQSDLVKFNKVINLIPPSGIKVADAEQFADCILASRLISKVIAPNAPLYDLSGNGFPGLIFAILYPAVKVELLDKDPRRIEFCKHVAAQVKVPNVTVSSKGLDEFPDSSVTNVVYRGAATLEKTMLAARKTVKKGGKLFHLKNDGWPNELARVPSQLFSFWTPELLGQYKLPEGSNEMAVVVTDKIAD